ncbi:methyltransferase domain-containing protein [Clostridium sp. A1-XYC3]|uniref:Methyltransferase domain-containing protein n=1 Tax=Clostridium tanneri TaxID=3037988 RepID=A0ABU4JX17_9CLOT|nr:methyltransferase domain-containing protein [Clostridium sp. A1-XYC3]MDW8802685.1 methyltransferase domain-containing protein [Clostridium sp. A1-XYC3]
MVSCNAYESRAMREALGTTLRPGGFCLTDEAVEFCKFKKGDKLLDIGCGMGATVEYLWDRYELEAVGIDPSRKLIEIGKKRNKKLNLVEGRGESLDFEKSSMKGIFAECTLSLMEDRNKVISEAYRVLAKDGYFIATDVYAKNPQFIHELKDFYFNSCMRGLHDLEELKEEFIRQGFKIALCKDCSDLLKQLMVKIIFTYGYMNIFWRNSTECSINSSKFEEILRRCKVGYFIIVGRKT